VSSAPVDVANPEPEEDDDGEMPRARITRREAVILGIFVVVAVGFLYFGLPQIAGLHETWDRIRDGDPSWISGAPLYISTSPRTQTVRL